MNTKIIMTSSAVFLGGIGILISFFPGEITEAMQVEENALSMLSLQLLSAFYIAFGFLNWMSKASPIGGIYNKPLAMANLTHYVLGTLAFMKLNQSIEIHTAILFGLNFVYLAFAVLFFFIQRTNPSK